MAACASGVRVGISAPGARQVSLTVLRGGFPKTKAGRSISFSQPSFPSRVPVYSAPFCSAWIRPSGFSGNGVGSKLFL